MTAFDPLRVPLTGTHLVEASAGTGKTHGLTALFVRLIAETTIKPQEIVLVTFTEAATRELRTRVRERLTMLAARLARGVPDESPEDLQVEALAQRVQGDAQALRRVRDAVLGLDDATISTIHGFARRVLTDFALESGAGFADLEPGDGALDLDRALHDFWRRETIAAPKGHAAWLLDQCDTPDALRKLLHEALRVDPSRLVPDVDPAAIEAASLALAASREAGARFAEQLHAEGRAIVSSGVVTKKAPYTSIDAHADALLAWLTDEARAMSPPLASLACYTHACIRSVATVRSGGIYQPRDPALFAWAERALSSAISCAYLSRAAFIARAAREIREAVADVQRERRVTSFDALIADLARLVASGDAPVVRAIRARYRLAIVDEFQDTDAEQYAIFRALFHGRADGGLFLIGDPKQAIYRFRGGDVFAYRGAAEDAGANRWTLTDNWRSDARLIEATNALFDPARVPRPFVHDFIDFRPSQYGEPRRSTPALVPIEAPMVAWTGARGTNKDDIQRDIQEAVAAEIAALLRLPTAHGKPLRIAVLLRTKFEFDACLDALARWNVPASAASNARVFDSEEARELEIVIAALAAPRDLRRARAALATDLVGYDDAAILALAEPGRLEAALGLLDGWRDAAMSNGPAALARALAQHAGARWLARFDGRRRVTNLLHIGAVLQSRWSTIDGLAALIACIARERDATGEEGELRPDAGGAPVEVLTIHKSKGLQWDVVFVPTLYAGKQSKVEDDPAKIERRLPVKYHGAKGGLFVDVGSPDWDRHAALAAEEAEAENVRIAYVALTRAKHRCYVYWGTSQHATCSPLMRLLHPGVGDRPGAADAERALQDWSVASGGAVDVRRLPAEIPFEPLAPPAAHPRYAPRAFAGRIDRSFQLASFSALFGGASDEPTDYDQRATDAPASVPGPVPSEPRGAAFGECVHEVLETVPFAALTDGSGVPRLAKICEKHGYGERATAYVAELARQTATAGIATGIRLAALPARALRAELEFFFPLEDVRLDAVAAALALEPRYARTPEEFAHLAPRWSGLMHGYVDLVYSHEGRAGLIDYKTNYLGSRYEDYGDAALAVAIRSHDYDLQYLIYTVAYVRHLRLRGRFDYERDFDGVAYLFVRGLAGEAGVYRDKPPRAVIDALDRAFGGGRSEVSR